MENTELFKQDDNSNIIEKYFGLSGDQLKILYYIESLLVQRDIDKSKKNIFTKEHWLTEWQKKIRKLIGDYNLDLSKTVTEIIEVIKNEIGKIGDNKWFKMALFEASLFIPYYPLASDEDDSSNTTSFKEYTEEELKLAEERVKAKNKELFDAMKSYKTDFDRLNEISDSTLGEDEKDYSLSCKKEFEKMKI